MKNVAALAIALAAAVVSANPSPVHVDAAATLVARTTSATLPTITTKGNAFYSGDDRFYIKGIDYQPGGSSQLIDPLADTTYCLRDIPYFTKLGLNTIRVYSVNNAADHDTCMAALADAGIYLILDVNTPKYSLNQDQPEKSYNKYYLQSVFATVDKFAGYSNVLAFTSGNEVVNAPNNTDAAPYVKAVTRDMKQYISERGYRPIPVGYGAADVVPEQYTLAQYLNCGESQTQVDFYGINNYEWCDPSSITTSGWDVLADQYKNFSIPVFLSEYGCITNTRTFQETPVLYSDTMAVSISGGFVYEFYDQGNGYGIFTLDGDTLTPVGNQYTYLMEAMEKISLPSGDGGATTQNTDQPCPDETKYFDISPFSGSALPALPSGASVYFTNGAGKGPGFAGDGSQWESGGSSATASAGAGSATTTYASGASSTGGSSSSSGGSSAASSTARADITTVLVSGLVLTLSFAFGVAAL